MSLVATLLGEGHSKIKPRVHNALEAVVEACRIREYTLIKNPGPSGWGFYDGLATQLSKKYTVTIFLEILFAYCIIFSVSVPHRPHTSEMVNNCV